MPWWKIKKRNSSFSQRWEARKILNTLKTNRETQLTKEQRYAIFSHANPVAFAKIIQLSCANQSPNNSKKSKNTKNLSSSPRAFLAANPGLAIRQDLSELAQALESIKQVYPNITSEQLQKLQIYDKAEVKNPADFANRINNRAKILRDNQKLALFIKSPAQLALSQALENYPWVTQHPDLYAAVCMHAAPNTLCETLNFLKTAVYRLDSLEDIMRPPGHELTVNLFAKQAKIMAENFKDIPEQQALLNVFKYLNAFNLLDPEIINILLRGAPNTVETLANEIVRINYEIIQLEKQGARFSKEERFILYNAIADLKPDNQLTPALLGNYILAMIDKAAIFDPHTEKPNFEKFIIQVGGTVYTVPSAVKNLFEKKYNESRGKYYVNLIQKRINEIAKTPEPPDYTDPVVASIYAALRIKNNAEMNNIMALIKTEKDLKIFAEYGGYIIGHTDPQSYMQALNALSDKGLLRPDVNAVVRISSEPMRVATALIGILNKDVAIDDTVLATVKEFIKKREYPNIQPPPPPTAQSAPEQPVGPGPAITPAQSLDSSRARSASQAKAEPKEPTTGLETNPDRKPSSSRKPSKQ